MNTYQETSMAAVFQNQVRKLGNKPMLAYKKYGAYVDISWNEMDDLVGKLARYLLTKDIRMGDKITLFSENRYEWYLADLAIISVGAVNVPIYSTNSAHEAQFVIEHSDARICFVSTLDHLERVLKVKENLPMLEEIIVFDDLKSPLQGAISLQHALALGDITDDQGEIERRITAIDRKSLATMIYTSGTTGNPKGVMLSHENILENIDQSYKVAPEEFDKGVREDYTLLSFLPLSHSFERTVGYYLPLTLGLKVYLAEDFSKILENFQEVRPHVIVSIPRLFEKIHAGVLAKAAEVTGIKQKIFEWMQSVSRRNLPYICENRKPTGLFALEYMLADKIIFTKLKAALGMDRLLYAFSAGAPLAVTDGEFFLGKGIRILEGYGLSETSPVASCNIPALIKPGTVGPPIKRTEIKTGEDGELLIRGSQVMMGYYKNEDATREVMTEDGFFRTGDIGEIDPAGYIKITGRIKDLIITSGGKNISPQNIENSLKASPFIEQVAIIGDNRKYLAALIVPAFEELTAWAKKDSIAFNDHADLIREERIIKLIEQEIATNTSHFARVEQIRKFTLLDSEWSQESGELTPTLKVKRRVINQKYETEIESMYPPG